MNIEELHIGQRVIWNDPDDGICSCPGTVVGIREDGEVDLRKNDGGYAIVMAHELNPEEAHKKKTDATDSHGTLKDYH